jgi:hypothetical protein
VNVHKLPRQEDSKDVDCCPASKRSRYAVGGRSQGVMRALFVVN